MPTERTSSGTGSVVLPILALIATAVFLAVPLLPAISAGSPVSRDASQGRAQPVVPGDPAHSSAQTPSAASADDSGDATSAPLSAPDADEGARSNKAGGATPREKDVFVPSEKILADSVVPFPVDI